MYWLDRMLSEIWSALVALALLLTGGGDAATRFQGYVEGEYVRVAAPVGGTLRDLAVERGDQVAAGTLLFLLEDDSQRMARNEAAARVQQAEAQLADLRKSRRRPEIEAIEARLAQARAKLDLSAVQLRRHQQLAASKVVAQSRLDEARATYELDQGRVAELEAELETVRLAARTDEIAAAEAAVEMARAQLAQAEWDLGERAGIAPAAALVADTFYREGEEVPGGAAIVSLLPPGNVKLRFFVPEPRLAAMAIGQTVSVRCHGCAEGLSARISYVSPEAEFTPPVIFSNESRAKLVFLVEAKPEGGARRLLPGQPVDVEP